MKVVISCQHWSPHMRAQINLWAIAICLFLQSKLSNSDSGTSIYLSQKRKGAEMAVTVAWGCEQR